MGPVWGQSSGRVGRQGGPLGMVTHAFSRSLQSIGQKVQLLAGTLSARLREGLCWEGAWKAPGVGSVSCPPVTFTPEPQWHLLGTALRQHSTIVSVDTGHDIVLRCALADSVRLTCTVLPVYWHTVFPHTCSPLARPPSSPGTTPRPSRRTPDSYARATAVSTQWWGRQGAVRNTMALCDQGVHNLIHCKSSSRVGQGTSKTGSRGPTPPANASSLQHNPQLAGL